MTALQLLQHAPSHRIILCERAPTFARGAAYRTDDPVHLLNVRASNMSAYPDRPNDFLDWLDARAPSPHAHVHETPAGRFVSRALFGEYLSALVQAVLASPNGAARLRIVPDEAVALEPTGASGYVLRLAGGRRHDVQGAVLAIGNLPAAEADSPRCVHDPWRTPFTEGLEPGRPVVVIGSALTMVDVVMSLREAGFSGPVRAISRRGLLPRPHVASAPHAIDHLDLTATRSLSERLRRLRAEARAAEHFGLSWQGVMDALRPVTSSLWRDLGPEGQARFLRHLRPWWDVHRHRTAPPVSRILQNLLESGYLTVSAGRLLAVRTDAAGAVVRWQPRGAPTTRTIQAQRVIFATGAPGAGKVKDALLRQIIGAGLARVDPHGFGVETAEDFGLVGGDGRPTPGLWGVGPIVRGSLWECTAVPDIRTDARRLAIEIARALTRDLGRDTGRFPARLGVG